MESFIEDILKSCPLHDVKNTYRLADWFSWPVTIPPPGAGTCENTQGQCYAFIFYSDNDRKLLRYSRYGKIKWLRWNGELGQEWW